MLEGPPEFVVMVFLATFTAGEYNDRKHQSECMDVAADDLEEMARESQEAYRKQVTKWIKGSLCALQDPVWWFFVHVSHRARAPIRHFFNILSNYGSWHASKAFRQDTPASKLPVVDLITNKLPQLDQEFRDLASSVCVWTRDILSNLQRMSIWCNHDRSLNDESMHAIALRMVLQNYTSFNRRVTALFKRPDLPLLFRL